MLDLHLVVSDRSDVPQRVLATCCRRQGAVLALAFERGGPDGTASLELTVDVEPRLRRGLIERIAGLVDVREVRVRPPVALCVELAVVRTNVNGGWVGRLRG
jgi:acetolactate synthase regulatory subunit